jgi:mannose-1-phosphate guanylyltransferase
LNALILSAGYGKRLGNKTLNTPKCLIKINKIPMLDIWLSKLENLNLKKIYINSHYLHKQVSDHLKKNKNKNIVMLHEKKLLGTSGTIFKNYKLFMNDDLLVIHCDNYTNFNLSALIRAHKKKPRYCLLTMLTFKTNKPCESGIVLKNKKKILIKYFEKTKNIFGFEANAAIYVISKNFFYDDIFSKCKKTFNFAEEVIPKILKRVFIYKTNKFYIDIGDRISLNLARKWARQNYTS